VFTNDAGLDDINEMNYLYRKQIFLSFNSCMSSNSSPQPIRKCCNRPEKFAVIYMRLSIFRQLLSKKATRYSLRTLCLTKF